MGLGARAPRACACVVIGVASLSAAPAAAATQARGEGTMLVRQSTDCSGTGNASVVSLPFSVLFTGFAPGATGSVHAYTQPGGEQVGHRDVTVDEGGDACERVTGDVAPGQYKIVYDFGSGTGKQKVIRIVGPEPSASATESPSGTATPTVTVPPTSAPSATSSSSSASTPAGSPTSTPSAGATVSSATGYLVFRPVPGGSLARTGGGRAIMRFPVIGAALLIVGTMLLFLARKHRPGEHRS